MEENENHEFWDNLQKAMQPLPPYMTAEEADKKFVEACGYKLHQLLYEARELTQNHFGHSNGETSSAKAEAAYHSIVELQSKICGDLDITW